MHAYMDLPSFKSRLTTQRSHTALFYSNLHFIHPFVNLLLYYGFKVTWESPFEKRYVNELMVKILREKNPLTKYLSFACHCIDILFIVQLRLDAFQVVLRLAAKVFLPLESVDARITITRSTNRISF